MTRRKIEKNLDQLAKGEREGEFHRWVSIIPWRSKKRNSHQLILDTLARLLTGQETCVAAFFSEKEWWLFITSNNSQPNYAWNYMQELTKYANFPSQENYDILLKFALENIFFLMGAEESAISIIAKGWTDFKCYLITEIAPKFPELSKGEWRRIESLAKFAFDEVKKTKRVSVDWEEYLSPLHDTFVIAEYLKIRDVHLDGYDAILREVIKQNRLWYWKNDNESKNNMHAEMKMLDILKREGKLFQGGYIGLSKLCCVPCQLMLNIINNKKQEGENKFDTCGTHGGTYSGWVIPDFYNEELLEKIENLHTKVRESTSEMPSDFQFRTQIEFPTE